MRKAALLILSILLVAACSDDSSDSSVFFVSVARDYGDYSSQNQLETPPQDQRGLSDELYYLSCRYGTEYTECLFLEEDGVWSRNGESQDWDTETVISTLWNLGTGNDDLVIFHYSGHGTESGALVIDDDAYLELDELLYWMEGIKGKKLLILDSCYSGLAIEDSAVLAGGESYSGGKLSSTSIITSAIASFGLVFSGKLTGLDDIWVLAACTGEQTSWDSWDTGESGQEDYGAFTYQVLKALGYDFGSSSPSRDGTGSITLYQLYSKIMDNIPSDLKTIATPQVKLSLMDLALFY